MTNHYHLLLETTQANISKIMHYLNGSYTTYYNIKRKRSGHLFQGRFKSIVVDKDSYFQELSRYIHLNPVKAKIAEQPEAYRWSSYRGYFDKKDPVLDYDRIKQCLGMDNNQYRQFVLSGLDKPLDPFKNIYAGFLLGSTQFIKEKLESLKDQINESREIAYKDTISAGVDIELIVRETGSRVSSRSQRIVYCQEKSRFSPGRCVSTLWLKTHLFE